MGGRPMTIKEQMPLKQIILQAVETLPEDADLDDALEHIVFVHTLQRRLENIDEGPTYTHEEVRRMMAEWRE
jgi:hypothetical protein